MWIDAICIVNRMSSEIFRSTIATNNTCRKGFPNLHCNNFFHNVLIISMGFTVDVEDVPSSELEYLPTFEEPFPPSNTLCRTSLTNTLKLYCFLRVREQVSHAHKVASIIVVSYI
jgi:hypothetical protein